MTRFTVLLTGDMHPTPKSLLEAVADVHISPAPDMETLRSVTASLNPDAILVRHLLPSDILDYGPSVRIMARHGVGLDFIPVAEATRRKVLVTNAPGSNTQAVVEHTLGVMLTLARHFPQLDRNTRAGDWLSRNTLTGFELHGRTLGVLGLGKVGMGVAMACSAAFSMRVLGYDPFLQEVPPHITRANVAEIFATADMVSLHVPLTEETRGLVNAALLATMKPGSFLINACRGEVIVDEDLAASLRSGPLAGAALDVFHHEPLAAGHPFQKLDNVLLTPHSAALTEESLIRMGEMAASDIVRVLTGDMPVYCANPEVLPAYQARYGCNA